jgi:hypothetical protein
LLCRMKTSCRPISAREFGARARLATGPGLAETDDVDDVLAGPDEVVPRRSWRAKGVEARRLWRVPRSGAQCLAAFLRKSVEGLSTLLDIAVRCAGEGRQAMAFGGEPTASFLAVLSSHRRSSKD